MAVTAAWSKDVKLILGELEVPSSAGLSQDVAEERLRNVGPNAITSHNKVSRWSIFLKQVLNPVVVILALAAGVSFFLGENMEGWAIVSIVIINCLIGYFQESKAESAIEALADLASPKGKVLRDGHVMTVSSETVVPGDILILEAGDYVVADARIISASQLSVDEAILTGESLPVEKSEASVAHETVLAERTNMVYASTAIARGTAKAVVTATGRETEIGKIARMMESTRAGKTPLQERLEGVSHRLLLMGIMIILAVLGLGWWRGESWEVMIMSALSLSVAAIPEGLPTVVTLALVMAVRRMAKKRALVRKMDSVETLGATDIICTDKTGTLTTGKMIVRETFILGDAQTFLETIILCNNSSLDDGGSGDTTEIALLVHAQKTGADLKLVRDLNPRLFEWSFDSERKRMSVAVKAGDRHLIHVKGAPENVLSRVILSEEDRTKISDVVSGFSRKGMRVLATAMKEISSPEVRTMSLDEAENGLTFTGLVALADPPRSETIPSIRNCQEAGIRIIMITGDHPETATAIARELGIINSDHTRALTGLEMDKLTQDELSQRAETVSVFARVSPENKLSLVNALRKSGHVVAMTGDGVNDAPALKAATIGVSMGKGGTEVARQASSMVLTDDNFSTIVDAVEEGRAVHGNIKRTLQYLLSTNLAELLFIFVTAVMGLPVPLLPVNLLWLNLVSDGLPSLALASEKVPRDYLRNSRKSSPDSFFDRAFIEEMILVGLIITVMSVLLYRYGLETSDLTTSRSYAFNFIVYAVLFRSFSCRNEYYTFLQMKPNYYHLLSVLIPVLIQLALQQNEVFLKAFHISSLDLKANFVLIFLALVPVTLVESFKLYRQKTRAKNR